MTSDAQTVLRQALELDEQDRLDIAASLLASVESDPADVAKAWDEELRRRADRYFAGELSTEDMDVALDRVLDELTP